jgi:hypothetical protein
MEKAKGKIVNVCEEVHQKNFSDFPIPGRDVTNQTLPGREGLNFNPTGESLVSHIPAGDGKIVNLFFTVCSFLLCEMIDSLVQ